MKKIKKSVYSAAATSLMLLTGASAKVPFTAIKGTTQFFNNPIYAPLVGAAALDSGIIETIRFFMNDTEKMDAEGERNYCEDEGADPHWKLVKALFPSNGGILNTETGATTSQTNSITPEIVALLMQYTEKLRNPREEDRRFFDKNTNTMVNRKVEVKANSEFFRNEILKKAGKKKSTLFDTFIRQLLINIESAVKNEKTGKGIFPTHTTEQIISAFLCFQHNTQGELLKYIEALQNLDTARKIVNDLRLEDPAASSSGAASSSQPSSSSGPSELSPLTVEDIPIVLNNLKNDIVKLEDIYNAEVAHYFYDPVPYRKGDPISNGHTYEVEGSDSVVHIDKRTFQDCNEEKIRHLINMTIFDPEARIFDLSFIDRIEGELPRTKYIKEFFAMQDIFKTDNGSRLMRTAFNKIVGDLNSLNPLNPIRYDSVRQTNELESGFINTIRVFEVLFGKTFLAFTPQDPQSKDMKKSIADAFVNIFQFLNPAKKAEVNSDDIKYDETFKDFIGEMRITVDKKFKFTIEEGLGHGEINNLKFISSDPRTHKLSDLLRNKQMALKSVVESAAAPFQALLLLSEETKGSVDDIFYKLASCNLSANQGIIDFVSIFLTLDENKQLSLKSLANEALENFGWDDAVMVERFFNVINYRGSSKVLDAAIQNGIKDTDILDFSQTNIDNFTFMQEMPKLIKLILPKNLRSIDRFRGFEHLTGLKQLGLDFTEIRHLVIPHLPHLNKIWMPNGVSEVGFTSDMPSLEGLVLPRTLERIDGLSHLTGLKGLDLRHTQITSLGFTSDMPSLEGLVLPRTLVRIEGLSHLTGLKGLDLSNTQITSLGFTSDMPSLERLSLPHTLVSIDGLSHLTGLKGLDLFDTQITSLGFTSDMPSLERLDLPRTLVRIEGHSHLTGLKSLSLWKTQITSLDFTSDMPSLEGLYLPRTLVSIDGLSHLTGLKGLDLFDTQITSLGFTSDMPSFEGLLLPPTLVSIEGLSHLTGLKEICLPDNYTFRLPSSQKDDWNIVPDRSGCDEQKRNVIVPRFSTIEWYD